MYNYTQLYIIMYYVLLCIMYYVLCIIMYYLLLQLCIKHIVIAQI